MCNLCKEENFGNIKFLGEVKKARTPLSLLCRLALWGIEDQTLNEKEVIQQLSKDNRKSLFILFKAPIPISRKILALLFALDYRIAKFIILLGKYGLKYN